VQGEVKCGGHARWLGRDGVEKLVRQTHCRGKLRCSTGEEDRGIGKGTGGVMGTSPSPWGSLGLANISRGRGMYVSHIPSSLPTENSGRGDDEGEGGEVWGEWSRDSLENLKGEGLNSAGGSTRKKEGRDSAGKE